MRTSRRHQHATARQFERPQLPLIKEEGNTSKCYVHDQPSNRKNCKIKQGPSTMGVWQAGKIMSTEQPGVDYHEYAVKANPTETFQVAEMASKVKDIEDSTSWPLASLGMETMLGKISSPSDET